MKTKPILLAILLLLITAIAHACPVCEKQQPKVLQGISHGTGPQSNLDYLFVCATGLVVLATLVFAVRWLVRPGEQTENHIKSTILDF